MNTEGSFFLPLEVLPLEVCGNCVLLLKFHERRMMVPLQGVSDQGFVFFVLQEQQMPTFFRSTTGFL